MVNFSPTQKKLPASRKTQMHTPESTKITAIIITFNEIGYIERCIDSIGFVDEIVVVDSHSTDGTYEYLVNRGDVRVFQHKFENFTLQKSYALGLASHDWILFPDADEVITLPLAQEIEEIISGSTPHAAFWVYREFMFHNKRLRFSGWQTDKNYRLFRKSKAKFTDHRLVHETLEVNGSSGILKHKIIHYSYKNYTDYKGKMLQYGRLKAQEAFRNGKQFSLVLMAIKPVWKFFNHFVLRLGFLDGKKGVLICYLNALGVFERFRYLRQLEQKN